MRRRLSIEALEPREVPTYLGNQLFPLDNPWNQNISAAPIASNSGAIISAIVNRHGGTAPRIHADFGNPATDGALYGIPVNVATSATPKYAITIAPGGWADESDSVMVPIPNNAILEGDGPTGPAPPGSRGDSHLLVYDRDANVLYELGSAARPSETSYPYGGSKPTGVWGAYQVSYWDLDTNYFRTIGATSADAAGLPMLTGLVRPDEVNPAPGGVGVIDHAIRMTVDQTRSSFVFPASHEASDLTGSNLPRMGERFRLKSSFVIPTIWSPEAQAIAQAMKTYGMIVADNGSDFFFQGMPSSQWVMDSVLQVQSIRANDFEVVDLTPAVTGLSVTSGPAAGGTLVTITGRNFAGAAGQLHVLFGGTEAASVTVLSDSQVVAVSPAHSAGTVDVRVQSGTTRTNTNGQPVFFGYGTSAITTAGRFTFGGGTTGNPPTAYPDAYPVVHDRTLTVSAPGVLGNDSDPDGDALSAAVVAAPLHGTLTLNANGSFTYKPAAGYTGSDSFTYAASDGILASSPATVALSVTDQAPAATNDSYKTGKGKTLAVSAAGVLGNDSDPDGDPLTAVLASGPANGTLTLNANGSFSYTPNAGFTGIDSFTYRANDKALDSTPATVTINVAAPPNLQSVVFGDGTAQRSIVRSITVTFDTLVTFDTGAFRLIRADGSIPAKTRTMTEVNGQTVVTLIFTGAGTIFRSLADGNWTLKVLKARVHRADDRLVVMDAQYVTHLHRFFGDSDGDRDVDEADQAAFNAAFGQTDATSLSVFDSDGDGDVDAADRARFNLRFGRTI